MHDLMLIHWGSDYKEHLDKIAVNGLSGGLVFRTAQMEFWNGLYPNLTMTCLKDIEDEYCIKIKSAMHSDIKAIIIKYLVERYAETL